MSVKDLQGDRTGAGCPESKLAGHGGFTLLELLVVVGIVSLLGTIGYPLYMDYLEKARNVRAVAEIRIISQEILTYQVESGAYPASLAEVNYGTLHDPWGNFYQYLDIQSVKGKGNFRKNKFMVPINTDYDLYSMGKDGQSQPPLTAKVSKDDIIRANNGGYIGLADNF